MSTPNIDQSISSILEGVTAARVGQLLANTARVCPELRMRPEKAAGLILLGRISADPEGNPDVFFVRGSAPEPYRVDLAADCSCPDYLHRAPEIRGRRFCGHMLACVVVAFLRDEQAKQRVAAAHEASRRLVRLCQYRARRRPNATPVARLRAV